MFLENRIEEEAQKRRLRKIIKSASFRSVCGSHIWPKREREWECVSDHLSRKIILNGAFLFIIIIIIFNMFFFFVLSSVYVDRCSANTTSLSTSTDWFLILDLWRFSYLLHPIVPKVCPRREPQVELFFSRLSSEIRPKSPALTDALGYSLDWRWDERQQTQKGREKGKTKKDVYTSREEEKWDLCLRWSFKMYSKGVISSFSR